MGRGKGERGKRERKKRPRTLYCIPNSRPFSSRRFRPFNNSSFTLTLCQVSDFACWLLVINFKNHPCLYIENKIKLRRKQPWEGVENKKILWSTFSPCLWLWFWCFYGSNNRISTEIFSAKVAKVWTRGRFKSSLWKLDSFRILWEARREYHFPKLSLHVKDWIVVLLSKFARAKHWPSTRLLNRLPAP